MTVIMKTELRASDITIALVLAVMFLVSIVTPAAYAAGESSATNRLILFQGFVLNAYYNDQYIEVKRLDPYSSGRKFYGYGWLDDNRVFVAYQGDTAEAVVEMEIIDLRHLRTTKLKNIGGVGESLFDVNPTTGDVIYSTGDEINLIKIDKKNNTYRVENIKQKTNCWAAFWVDNRTIGCKLLEKNKDVFVKYIVPQ